MSAAEGWAAQRLSLPAWWYQHIAESAKLEFPISADATAGYDWDAHTFLREMP